MFPPGRTPHLAVIKIFLCESFIWVCPWAPQPVREIFTSVSDLLHIVDILCSFSVLAIQHCVIILILNIEFLKKLSNFKYITYIVVINALISDRCAYLLSDWSETVH